MKPDTTTGLGPKSVPATILPEGTRLSPASDPSPDLVFIESMTRKEFALEAFKILVTKQVNDGRFEQEIAGTWAWRFADAAMRAQKTIYKPTVTAQGIRIVEPLAEIKSESNGPAIMEPVGEQPFNPATALIPKP